MPTLSPDTGPAPVCSWCAKYQRFSQSCCYRCWWTAGNCYVIYQLLLQSILSGTGFRGQCIGCSGWRWWFGGSTSIGTPFRLFEVGAEARLLELLLLLDMESVVLIHSGQIPLLWSRGRWSCEWMWLNLAQVKWRQGGTRWNCRVWGKGEFLQYIEHNSWVSEEQIFTLPGHDYQCSSAHLLYSAESLPFKTMRFQPIMLMMSIKLLLIVYCTVGYHVVGLDCRAL